MDQLLIALDVDRAEQALALSAELGDVAGGFKIGSRLFTAEGPSVVREMVKRDYRVFLDLKYHDIPSTVKGAVAMAADLGVWMLTVHASGGRAMMQAALEAAAGGRPRPRVVAVTVLTSFDRPTLASLGVGRSIPEQVTALARLARDAGVDGVVASPLEIALVREACGPSLIVVTPGIRDSVGASATDDQARTMTAGDALRAGASYLVVGRPVIAAPNPRAAAQRLHEQMARSTA